MVAGVTEGKEDTAEVEEKAGTVTARDIKTAVKAVMGKAAVAAIRKAAGKAAKEAEKEREITARNAEQIDALSHPHIPFVKRK